MMKKFTPLILLSVLLNCFYGCTKETTSMRDGFIAPPDDTKPGIYWYWMNENVSKEGITKDLESLFDKGVGEVYIGNIYDGGELGKVPTLSDEWVECMQHAIREGTRIGMNISTFNSPGWSQSGGPWVKPEDAMRYLVYSEIEVSGPSVVKQNIEKPKDFFQDVAVLAYPVTIEEPSQQPIITTKPTLLNPANLVDNDTGTICSFLNKKKEEVQIDIRYNQPETIRSLYIKPGDQRFHMYCDVYMKQGEGFKLLKSHYFDRINREVRMGADPSAPLALSLGEVTSTEFRIVMKELPEKFELRELKLSSKPILENYPEKWLIKIPSKATPDWYAHIWNNQSQPNQEGIIAENQILNISQYLKGDRLEWEAPKGKWKILRVGMSTTNTTNQPAAPVARGLEIDKMNKRAIESHYNAYVGKITSGMTKEDLKSFTRVIADSYETGPENWTDDFAPVFVERYGYDPYPWMAILTGQIVGSVDQSNRFLWDLRRLVAERVASEYVGGMKEICEKNGTQLWLENYGWDGFPSEFILYSKYSPAVGGEFWTNAGDNIECRLAASGCHMYGKNTVYAESYTTSGAAFEYYPEKLKKFGDRSYADGINQHILHLCIHQPYESRVPGINSWFGIEYNRHNTWFEQSKSWIDYQRRCCYMLKQGRHHADVCYFIGEESPRMSGWVDENLSEGYDYDFINSDVIEQVIEVKNGRLILPSGISYSLLVLPPLKTMRPALLKRIKELIEQGANVLGKPVERSPSMAGYPACDKEVQRLASEIWGISDYATKQQIEKKLGRGRIFCNVPINTVLSTLGISESIVFNQALPVLWKQRSLGRGEVFFISNQEDQPLSFEVEFRVTGLQPELWNPVDGTTRELPDFTFADGKTKVPMQLAGYESCFIVFQKSTKGPDASLSTKGNYPLGKTLLTLDKTWDIDYLNQWTGEKFEFRQQEPEDWSKSDNEQLRYFSGTATYRNEFDLSEQLKSTDVYVTFEHMHEVATVAINGHIIEQIIWCKPYRLNIGTYLQKGKNILEVKVSNSWKNKIQEQKQKAAEERNISLLFYGVNPGLSPSGIWGDVKIVLPE